MSSISAAPTAPFPAMGSSDPIASIKSSLRELDLDPSSYIPKEALDPSRPASRKTIIYFNKVFVRVMGLGSYLIAFSGECVFLALDDVRELYQVIGNASFTAPSDQMKHLCIRPTDQVPSPEFWKTVDAIFRFKQLEELRKNQCFLLANDVERSLLSRLLPHNVIEIECPAKLRIHAKPGAIFITGLDMQEMCHAFYYRDGKWWELATRGHAAFLGVNPNVLGPMFSGTNTTVCEPMRIPPPDEWLPAVKMVVPHEYELMRNDEFNPQDMTKSQFVQLMLRRIDIEGRNPEVLSSDHKDGDSPPSLFTGCPPWVVGSEQFPDGSSLCSCCNGRYVRRDRLNDFDFVFCSSLQSWFMLVPRSCIPEPVALEAEERQLGIINFVGTLRSDMLAPDFLAREVGLLEQVEAERAAALGRYRQKLGEISQREFTQERLNFRAGAGAGAGAVLENLFEFKYKEYMCIKEIYDSLIKAYLSAYKKEVQETIVLPIPISNVMDPRYSGPKRRRFVSPFAPEVLWPQVTASSASNKPFRGAVCSSLPGQHQCSLHTNLEAERAAGTACKAAVIMHDVAQKSGNLNDLERAESADREATRTASIAKKERLQHYMHFIHLWNSLCPWPGFTERKAADQIETRDRYIDTDPIVPLASCFVNNFGVNPENSHLSNIIWLHKRQEIASLFKESTDLQTLADGAVIPAQGQSAEAADSTGNPLYGTKELLLESSISWASLDRLQELMPSDFFRYVPSVLQMVQRNPSVYLSNPKASTDAIVEALAITSKLMPQPEPTLEHPTVCLSSGRGALEAFEWASSQGLLQPSVSYAQAVGANPAHPAAAAGGGGGGPAAAAGGGGGGGPAPPAVGFPSDFEHDRQCRMTCRDPECLRVHVPGTACAREEAGEECKIFHHGNRNQFRRGCPFGHQCQGPYILPHGRVAVGFQSWMFTGTNKHRIQYEGGLTLAGRNARQ